MIRYQVLDKCFSNRGRRYFMENLIDECNSAIYEFSGSEIGIKKRQLFEDIKFMESPQGWNIPLERMRDGHKVYFQYSDKEYSINRQILKETDANLLKEALATLSRFKGLPQFEWVAEITARIDSSLSLTTNKQNIIEFESNNYLQGLDFITPIYTAILYNQTLQISYKSFKQDEKQSLTIHPYFLKQFNNRWFFFGLSDRSNEIANLALDRIIEIKHSKVKYKPNSAIDFDEYFEDVVGVTVHKEKKVEHIVIEVNNELLPYIETKPLHGSQKIKSRQLASTSISLDLIPNYELESLLLSFGDGLRVIEPLELKLKIMERVKKGQVKKLGSAF